MCFNVINSKKFVLPFKFKSGFWRHILVTFDQNSHLCASFTGQRDDGSCGESRSTVFPGSTIAVFSFGWSTISHTKSTIFPHQLWSLPHPHLHWHPKQQARPVQVAEGGSSQMWGSIVPRKPTHQAGVLKLCHPLVLYVIFFYYLYIYHFRLGFMICHFSSWSSCVI